MFKNGNIKASGSLEQNVGILYTEWKGRRHRTLNNKNQEVIITLSKSKRAVHHIDYRPYTMRGHQVHIVFPGQSSYFSVLEDTTAHQLIISCQTFESICLALRFNPYLYKTNPVQDLNQFEFETFIYEFTKIGYELNISSPLFEIINARTRITLQEISRILEKRISRIQILTTPQILVDFLDLIELHYKKEHTVRYYANVLNTQTGYLATLTRKHLQISPIKLIQQRILSEAKRLLSANHITIKAVMLEIGFTDQSVFAHFFKNLTGMSASTFRKNTLKP
ncbi:helix-turn-helix domain-containing protein [Sphingobacterium detergens]